MFLTADVAVWDATIYYDKLYTYEVPTLMEGHVFVGGLVLVPFGRGTVKPRMGVVLSFNKTADLPKRTKKILDAAPEDAKLNDELISVVKYLKKATFCTWYEAVKAVLPRGAQYKVVNENNGWKLKQMMSRHIELLYCLADKPAEDSGRKLTEKQVKVLDFLKNAPSTKAALMRECSVGQSVADGLVKRGFLKIYEQDKVVNALQGGFCNEKKFAKAPQIELSCLQQQIANKLMLEMNGTQKKPALLHGVTGSGKTSIFLTLAHEALKQNKTALILVPEIGLTPQMLRQMNEHFGKNVAVLHSRLSQTERLLQWRLIQKKGASVVVGTRSAVFAPLENVGIIIVDEEQERTYQSESAPRYDAIEVAKRRAVYHGALLVLASATPSISDYYFAKSGRYSLHSLNERYGNLPLPMAEIVDMQEEKNNGNTGIISNQLSQNVLDTVQNGKQAILLLNRRGYHRVSVCQDCGEAIKCDDCSVPMVLHKGVKGQAGKLMCHYCGKSISPPPEFCPKCNGEVKYVGFGTQRLEQELEERFSGMRVLRMDLDSTSKKGAHARMFEKFAKGEYDVMVGTQMVAKGLNFPNVSLVGVIGIDSLLFGQGYRAFENVFSLVTQVVGRSGRVGAQGHAIVQTMDADNLVLNLAAKQDYEAFYEQEISFRKLALYPPFCNICVASFVAKSEDEALFASLGFARIFSRHASVLGNMPLRVLGPAPMGVVMIAGNYRYKLTIKCRVDENFRKFVWDVIKVYDEEGLPRKASVSLDFHSS